MPIKIDITGQRFNRWVVLYKNGRAKNRETLWHCKCDCGKESDVGSYQLVKGKSKSCGCLSNEIKGRRAKPYGEASFNKVYTGYIHSAKRREYDFNLTEKQFMKLTQQNCYYCGKKPERISLGKLGIKAGIFIWNGIDRVDNSEGYSIDNCVPCCFQCNKSKGEMSHEEFKIWIKQVYLNLF
jgi:5-methylcytosine-specific restriction endonuclease McrA